MVIADPETGEVQRVGDRRERVLPPRHLAPRVRARPGAAARARAVRAAARGGRVERYARAQPYLEHLALRRRRAARRTGRRPRRRPPRLRVLRAGDVLWRRDLGVLCGVLASTEHLTVATLEIGPGEVAAHARARRRRGPDGARRPALGPRLARRRRARVRARAGGRLLPARRQPCTSTATRAGRPRARSAGSRPATCRDASPSGSTSAATKLAGRTGRHDQRRGAGARRGADAARPRRRTPCSPTASRSRRRRWGDGAARARASASSSTPPAACAAPRPIDWRAADLCRVRPRSSPTCAPRRSPRRASAPAATTSST